MGDSGREGKTTVQCSVVSGLLLWVHLWNMEGEFDCLFHLNFPRIAHLLHLLLFCWSFSNDKWPVVKLSVTYQPIPPLLPQ